MKTFGIVCDTSDKAEPAQTVRVRLHLPEIQALLGWSGAACTLYNKAYLLASRRAAIELYQAVRLAMFVASCTGFMAALIRASASCNL